MFVKLLRNTNCNRTFFKIKSVLHKNYKNRIFEITSFASLQLAVRFTMTRLTLFGLTLIVVVLSNVALGLLSPKLSQLKKFKKIYINFLKYIACYISYFMFPEKYSVDPKSVTVSGISSGGAMSSQFHYIYSNEVKGAGIFAAGTLQILTSKNLQNYKNFLINLFSRSLFVCL